MDVYLVVKIQSALIMKTILSLLVLFSITLGLQQVQAQEGRSYEEWLQSSASGKKTVAAKPARSTKPAARPAAEEKATAPAAALAAPMGTFKGNLPCADCQGITTELSLNGGSNGTSRTFTLKQTYQGKPADKGVVTSSGKWFLAKGNKQDPDAVILQLIPTAGNIDPMYFLQVSESEVKLLDRQQAEIASRNNYSLKKQ
ncbi:hypothetical protein OB13_08230 [Pontibacter sp. HJ8]